MTQQLGRAFVVFSAALIVFIGCRGRDTSTAKPPTVRVSSSLPIPVEIATAPFRIECSADEIHGEGVSPDEAADFLAMLAREYSIYPREFFEATKLHSIMLCRKLAVGTQLRAAVPDYDHDILYFDVARGSYDEFYQRRVVHHELFHVIDWRDDSLVYEDADWVKLNPDSFRYGPGGAALQSDESQGELQNSVPGFLTQFSMAGVEEDKAELYSLMILCPTLANKRAEHDEILSFKAKKMKALLRDFCPQLDGEFWQRVERANRNTVFGSKRDSHPG